MAVYEPEVIIRGGVADPDRVLVFFRMSRGNGRARGGGGRGYGVDTSRFGLVQYLSLLQRVHEQVSTAAFAHHLWQRVLAGDSGIRDRASWNLLSTGFKLPPEGRGVLLKAHTDLRRWVEFMLFGDPYDHDRDDAAGAPAAARPAEGATRDAQQQQPQPAAAPAEKQAEEHAAPAPAAPAAAKPRALPKVHAFDVTAFDRSIRRESDEIYKLTLSTFESQSRAAAQSLLCADRGQAALNKFIDDEAERGTPARAQMLAFKIQLSDCMDQFLAALCPIVGAAIFAELLNKPALFAQQTVRASKLASQFLTLFLPLCQRTLDTLLGPEQEWLATRFMRRSDAGCTSDKERRLVRKIRLFDACLSALDLFVFPVTVQVHQSTGIKCIAAAHKRQNVVATASCEFLLCGLFGLPRTGTSVCVCVCVRERVGMVCPLDSPSQQQLLLRLRLLHTRQTTAPCAFSACRTNRAPKRNRWSPSSCPGASAAGWPCPNRGRGRCWACCGATRAS